MRNIALAILMATLAATPLTKASPAEEYPQTTAVLQLLYSDQCKLARTYNAFARQAHIEKIANVDSFFAALEASVITRAEITAAVLQQMGASPAEPADTEVRVAGTKSNLKLMANMEAAKMQKRYEVLLDQIKPEGHAVAIQTVTHAWKVDKGRRELADEVLSRIERLFGIGQGPGDFYVCTSCGAVSAGRPDLTCPVCQGPISDYELVNARWRVYRALDDNRDLTDDERAFAKRVYDHIYDTCDPSEDVSLGMNALYNDAYRKWGLGPSREFSPEEKTYIVQLEQMDHMWQTYQTIDTDSLDEADKNFLRDMHDKYGAGPINLRKEQARDKNASPEVRKFLDMVELTAGRSDLADKDLLFLRTLIANTDAK